MPNFLVNKADPLEFAWAEDTVGDLADGEALFSIERFALTANNLSYATVGERLGYWRYFPAARDGWGQIPVWGFATATASRCRDLALGRRIFGFFPMAPQVVLRPGKVTDGQFIEQSAHRADLPEPYNTYHNPAGWRIGNEDFFAVLNPLYLTGWLFAQDLLENDCFGARDVVVIGASSKTAIALAYFLARARKVRIVGLTSARNAAFVSETGLYDAVTDYDTLAYLNGSSCVVVDFSGNAELIDRVHRHLDGRIVVSSLIGNTHWSSASNYRDIHPPRPRFFFAPDHVRRGSERWGVEGFRARSSEAWTEFAARAERWFQVDRVDTITAFEAAYADLVAGRAAPRRAIVADFRSI